MSPERKRDTIETGAQGFMNRLIAISKTRGYTPLAPLFAESNYEVKPLPEAAILTGKWNYNFTRLSQGFMDMDILCERTPTVWNPQGQELTIRIRLGDPIVFPSAELVDGLISDLEKVI